jgi:hypothetical protein
MRKPKPENSFTDPGGTVSRRQWEYLLALYRAKLV